MGFSNNRNGDRIRLGQFRQNLQFSCMIHTHFQDEHFTIFRHVQNRIRHADVVVVVALGLVSDKALAQDRRRQVLRGSLAVTTGNRHDFRL